MVKRKQMKALIIACCLFASCDEMSFSEHLWHCAQERCAYRKVLFTRPLSVFQIQIIAKSIIDSFPHYDSVYVTVLPHRAVGQMYSVTDNPTLLLIRFWGKSDGNFARFFDPQGDSLQYLNHLMQGMENPKFPIDTINRDSILYTSMLSRATAWLDTTKH